MKAYLMFKQEDFNAKEVPVYGASALTADLELGEILSAMAREDPVILQASTGALLHPLHSPEAIRYRQDAVRDCLRSPHVVRELYAIVTAAIAAQRKGYWYIPTAYLSSLLSNSVNLLLVLTEHMAMLRRVADLNTSNFSSEAFSRLFTMLQRELDDDYLSLVNEHLGELRSRDALLISARLGNYNQGIGYVLRRTERKGHWRRWLFTPSYTIANRDDAGASDLANRRDRAINEIANALAQSAEHVKGFFEMLRDELAFYVGCINLYDALKACGMPACIPSLLEGRGLYRTCRGLYDASLALMTGGAVGNDLCAQGMSLYVITGPNQGGKSTFLRSVGQAQLMMECGMFVPASEYAAHIATGIFTHFKREEDVYMKCGKLEEELERMSGIVDHLSPGSLMLLNESFAATNEREGSELCRQITAALIESGIEVFFVTHQFTFADTLHKQQLPNVTFLRAQRLENGQRTFRIVPGLPLQTAFGEDLYHRIFSSGSGSKVRP